MLYKTIKRAIERKNYITKEDMEEKIAILYTNNQLTKEQYEELITLLREEEVR